MKKTFDFNIDDEEVVKKNGGIFEWYNFWPTIIGALIAILGVVCGVVFSDVISATGVAESGAVVIWFTVGGIIIGLIAFALLKVLCSYKLLHIYYLKKLVSQMERIKESKAEDKTQND
ncbi:MAG: hypothetical protein J6B79_03965 [Clostridia bacterium]|nr:hypothetical protein [Clostridia bacterium]